MYVELRIIDGVLRQYARITLNKTTTFFFLLAFVHCLTQGIIQASLLSIDTAYTNLLDSLIDPLTQVKSNIAPKNFTYLTDDRGNGDFSGFVLRMCDDIPFSGLTSDPCMEVFADGVSSIHLLWLGSAGIIQLS